MIATILLILLIMWLMGMGFGVTAHGLIHLLLVVIVVVVVVRLVRGDKIL